MTAVARKSGAPSGGVRAFALVLAALATGIPLFLLLLGLSIKTVEAIREARMTVNLIPIEPPPPPVEQPRPAPAKPADRAAAPAPAAPRMTTPVDQSPTVLPAPAAPPTGTVSGTGTGDTPGTGLGGPGPGGNGNGPIGGTAKPPPVRTTASWIYKPDTQDLLPYNPPRAQKEDVSGEVLLTCRVLRNTRVTDCKVASETPRFYGFGIAAVQASRMFRLKPPTIDGQPDEARRIVIPVTFNNRRN